MDQQFIKFDDGDIGALIIAQNQFFRPFFRKISRNL
jgi:hypothetical protein